MIIIIIIITKTFFIIIKLYFVFTITIIIAIIKLIKSNYAAIRLIESIIIFIIAKLLNL